jgi:O-antigen/teichoic acid export membrane protein
MSPATARRNILVMFTGRGISAVAALLFVTVVPRILGPSDYGYYSFWFAQLFLLFTALDLGSVDLVRRYLPNLIKTESPEARTLVKKVLLIKACLIPVALFLLPLYEAKWAFMAIFLASTAAALSYILSEVNFAANRMIWYSAHHIMRKLVRFVLIVILFILFARIGIIWALVITELVILVLFAATTRSVLPCGPPGPMTRPFISYMSFGVLLYLSTLLFLATGRLPVVIARARGLSFEEIGYLALVIDIFYFALRELFYGISESLLPLQAVHHEQGRSDKLPGSFNTVIRLSTAVIFPCLFTLALLPKEILVLIGREFLPSLKLFLWFIPVVVLNVLSFIYRQVLILYEHKGRIFAINVASFTIFLVPALLADPVTLPLLALAVAGASAVNCLLMWGFSRQIMRVTDEGSLYGKIVLLAAGLFIPAYLAGGHGLMIRMIVLVLGLAGYLAALNLTGLLRWEELTGLRRHFERSSP